MSLEVRKNRVILHTHTHTHTPSNGLISFDISIDFTTISIENLDMGSLAFFKETIQLFTNAIIYFPFYHSTVTN